MITEPKQNNCNSVDNRTEKFLKALTTANPGVWVRVTAAKKKSGPKYKDKRIKDRRDQRIEILKRVEDALNLMGMDYEFKWNAPYTLRLK